MSHTYAANFVHCVFGTKDRNHLIPEHLQEQLHAYLYGIAKNLGCKVLAAGGMPDHIHLLIALPPSARLAEIVQKVKANSSRWLGAQGVSFEWQKGYGAFSVSPSLVETVQKYIRNQPEHHRQRDFRAEFMALVRKAGIEFDERWDGGLSAVPGGTPSYDKLTPRLRAGLLNGAAFWRLFLAQPLHPRIRADEQLTVSPFASRS